MSAVGDCDQETESDRNGMLNPVTVNQPPIQHCRDKFR